MGDSSIDRSVVDEFHHGGSSSVDTVHVGSVSIDMTPRNASVLSRQPSPELIASLDCN